MMNAVGKTLGDKTVFCIPSCSLISKQDTAFYSCLLHWSVKPAANIEYLWISMAFLMM